MASAFAFRKVQKTIIYNGEPVKDVILEGITPKKPMIANATDLSSNVAFGMPSLGIVAFDVGGNRFEFYMHVSVDRGFKSIEEQEGNYRPIDEQSTTDMISYHNALKINCSCIHNSSMARSMHVMAQVVKASHTMEYVETPTGAEAHAKALVVIEVTLRTASSLLAHIPGTGYSDKIWDKNTKYVHVPVSPGNRLKVTEGMGF